MSECVKLLQRVLLRPLNLALNSFRVVKQTGLSKRQMRLRGDRVVPAFQRLGMQSAEAAQLSMPES